MSSDSDSDSGLRQERRTDMDSGSDCPDERDWWVSSDEEEDRDMADLGATATCVESFTASNHSSQIVTREDIELQTTIPRVVDANISKSEADIENRQRALPPGSVIQYNVSQTYNLQKFGDVTVKGTKNLNIGGTQNISKKAEPSQEEEEKPLTTTQKIRKRTESRLRTWTRGMVKTQSLMKVLDKIHKGATWVTVKGSPGEGKTTTAYMALEELYTEGRQVFQVVSPEEFSEVIMTSSRPVIMLDDVFGDLEFDETEWVRWKSALKLVLDVKEHRSDDHGVVMNKGATVILTGRNYILGSAADHMGRFSDFVTQEQYVVDMSHSVERELHEKLEIWAARVTTRGIKLADDVIEKICQLKSQHGFPHVCRMFADMYLKNKKLNAEDFFKGPLEFLNKTIVKFMKSENKLTLFEEMMKGDGKVSTCDLRRLKRGVKIIQTANDLVGPYLKKEGIYYTFDHPSIYDSVAYNLCKLDPLFVIANCNLSFIYQRIQLRAQEDSAKAESRSGLVYYIPRDFIKDLAARFAFEIEKRNLFYALSHTACSDEMFVRQMMLEVRLPLNQLFHLPDNKTGEHFLSLVASSKSFYLLKYIHDSYGELTKDETKSVLFGVCRFAAGAVLTYLVSTFEDLDLNARTRTTRQTPLMTASESGNRKFVLQMMSFNPDLNAQDIEGKSVFHYLCENGHVSGVADLINKGADINKKTQWGRSPLWFACLRNQAEIITLLLDRGAQVDIQVVSVLCRKGNLDVIQHIIDKNCIINIPHSGKTPLHVACEFGISKITSFLSSKGSVNTSVNMNAKDMLGNTPLHMAAMSGSKKCIEVMLKAGAKVNAQNNNGYTPLHNAVGSESEECITLLLQNGADVNTQSVDGYTSLHIAAKSRSTECMKSLLKAGADVNVRSNDGYTALHKAAGVGCKDCTGLLLKAGADVNVRSRDGHSALHNAAAAGCKDCVGLLLTAGADVNVQTDNGWTPLHWAAGKVYVECTKLLIKAGADVNMKTSYGTTILHRAALAVAVKECFPYHWRCRILINEMTCGHITPEGGECVMALILKSGGRVNEANKDGVTPLHTVARNGHYVNMLLKAGADPSPRTVDGFTPLHTATAGGCEESVGLLLHAGAVVNAQTTDSSTPLHLAAEKGFTTLYKLLLTAGADANKEDQRGYTPLQALQRRWPSIAL